MNRAQWWNNPKYFRIQMREWALLWRALDGCEFEDLSPHRLLWAKKCRDRSLLLAVPGLKVASQLSHKD